MSPKNMHIGFGKMLTLFTLTFAILTCLFGSMGMVSSMNITDDNNPFYDNAFNYTCISDQGKTFKTIICINSANINIVLVSLNR